MQVYYGPGTQGMVEVYRMMQRQARAWQRTWDRVVSRVRGPGYGNSYGKGVGTTRYDQTLQMPPLPAAGTDKAATDTEFKVAVQKLDRAAAKGVIHKNAAARKKSRLSAMLKKAKAAAK